MFILETSPKPSSRKKFGGREKHQRRAYKATGLIKKLERRLLWWRGPRQCLRGLGGRC